MKFLIKYCACLAIFTTASFPLFLSPLTRIDKSTVVDIAVVKSIDKEPYNQAVDGFKEVLAEKNITANLKVFDLSKQGEEHINRTIQSHPPALILTVGTSATKSIAEKIKDIPIVFSLVMDPEASSITAKNIVGASVDIPVKIHLETMKRVVPKFKRIGVVYNPVENEALIRQAKQVAKDLGYILKTYPVHSEKEIPGIKDLQIDILWIIPDSTVCKPAILKRILLSSIKSRVAVVGFSRMYARAGAIIGIGCDYKDVGRQSGEIAIKILKGENYSHLEITRPRKVKLYFNKTVAQRLGIIIPGKILQKASEVF